MRRHKSRSRASNRVTRLEEKLDNFVSFLRAEKGLPPAQSDRDAIDEDGCEEDEDDEEDDAELLQNPTPDAAIPTPATTVAKWPSTSGSPNGWDTLSIDEPSPAEAEESLKEFREETIVGFLGHLKSSGGKGSFADIDSTVVLPISLYTTARLLSAA